MNAVVLDASAILAMTSGEPGAERVKSVLAQSVATTVNFAEVVGYLMRRGVSETATREMLIPLPICWAEFDEDLAYRAGILAPETRAAGLSLGDRACLALAQRLGAPALTADRAWRTVDVGVAVEIIR